ncbi:FAD-dependent oxidoreductase [Vibrio maerlii]|uniref:FAD-dependent oxidoreductase n=1 Tax=Vibrio maerlii TaxID=2231648 RepID=UPI000E3E51E4|nr:FAD-dependent oxidoreductase [Vibrio maerlii]
MDNQSKPISVAVVGGGISGSTCAMLLAEQGANVSLIEKGPSLVNGPPICHLHAGGNLYREISEHQCLELLRQSIDTVRLYPQCLNVRPTVVAVPKSDNGDPLALLPRLKLIQSTYQQLVSQDERNSVLGEPADYYRLYKREDIEALANSTQTDLKDIDQWLIPFAKHVDLEQLKFPIVVVQEFGLSVFRMAAMADLAVSTIPSCNVRLNTELLGASESENGWRLELRNGDQTYSQHFDYLVNASGFETGKIDDLVSKPKQRFVEFKAAYVTRWSDCNEQWPEVIFHGERGTPKGMAQLTPYAGGYFQLHGMTEEITLFKGGLVGSSHLSSQPRLPNAYTRKINQGWSNEIQQSRTEKAIHHLACFIPSFVTAQVGGKPLYGAQQIPGNDPSLRAADVHFEGNNYARVEIVKASSAIDAAMKLIKHLGLSDGNAEQIIESYSPNLSGLSANEVVLRAEELALQRGYPVELAQVSGLN